MSTRLTRMLAQTVAGRRGFAMPAVIVALVIMGTLGVAAIMTSSDDTRSSRALRESGEAFYAAEAGLSDAWSTWNKTQVGALNEGESLDLGWKTLDNGTTYRAQVTRTDNGNNTQAVYWLRVEGRGADPQSGQRTLSLYLTLRTRTPFERAAAVTRGDVHMGDDNRSSGPNCGWGCRTNGEPWMIGQDGPPDTWDPNTCTDPNDRPAILTDDDTPVDMHAENDGFHQAPNPASQSVTDPIVADPNQVDDNTFTQFGGLTKQDLINMADHTFPPWDGLPNGTTYPTVNCADGNGILFENSAQPATCVCDTGNPMNWGSNDPANPCYNYHPIIYLPDGAEIRGIIPGTDDCGYGQAIVISNGPVKMGHHDCGPGYGPNAKNYEFAGIAIVQGCLELVYGTSFFGTAFVDDDMSGSGHPDCDVSGGFEGNGLIGNMNTTYQFSSCAVRRALDANNLDPAVRGWQRLPSRSFFEERL